MTDEFFRFFLRTASFFRKCAPYGKEFGEPSATSCAIASEKPLFVAQVISLVSTPGYIYF